MKLSKKQKEVIRYMRQGYCLTKNITYCYLECSGEKCSTATFFVLKRLGLIKQSGKFIQGYGVPYLLTDPGKTIEI